MAIITEATIKCPYCDHRQTQTMAENACEIVYHCAGCGQRLVPRAGDCCVYCSYGTVPCPPIQRERAIGGHMGSRKA